MSQLADTSPIKIYEVNDCVIDVNLHEISRDGDVIRPDSRTFDTLVYLLENRERSVSLEELQRCLWPNEELSEFELLRSILLARRAILDDEQKQLIRYNDDGTYQYSGEVWEMEID